MNLYHVKLKNILIFSLLELFFLRIEGGAFPLCVAQG